MEKHRESITLSIVTVSAFDHERLKLTIASFPNRKMNLDHIIVIPPEDFTSYQLAKDFRHRTSNEVTIEIDSGSGIYSAMNQGLFLSKSKYLLFLNSGDCIHDANSLENFIDFLSHTVTDLVFCQAKFSSIDGQDLSFLNYDNFIHIVGGYLSHQSCALLRQSDFIGPGFSMRYRVAADIELMSRVGRQGLVAFFHEPVVQVEDGRFSAHNNRRGRFENFLIAATLPTLPSKFTSFSFLFSREMYFLLRKLIPSTPKSRK